MVWGLPVALLLTVSVELSAVVTVGVKVTLPWHDVFGAIGKPTHPLS